MADITLAECNGRIWLVGGVEHMNRLLANTLPPDISTEFVQCETVNDVQRLWDQNNTESGAGSAWHLHPGIAARLKRATPDFAVYFAQWSALLDQDAVIVVHAAVARARDLGAAPVRLAQYLAPDGPRAMAALAELRCQLIEDLMTEGGIDPARFIREMRDVTSVPGMGAESQRVDVVVGVA